VLLWGDGNPDRLPELASELIDSGIDLVVAGSLVATRAVRAVTATIPVVMAGSADPVQAGIVESLSGPGGNVTGITVKPTTSSVSTSNYSARLCLLYCESR